MRWLAKTIGYIRWSIAAVGVLSVVAIATWTFFVSMTEGLTVTQAAVWGIAALGAGFLLVAGIAYCLDQLAALLPEVIGRQKVAAFFKEMTLHDKHEAITLSAVVYFWSGGKNAETPMDVIRADFKLHHLKAAIAQRKLVAQGQRGDVVLESTLCRPADLADFFGSWRWIFVDDSQWKDARIP